MVLPWGFLQNHQSYYHQVLIKSMILFMQRQNDTVCLDRQDLCFLAGAFLLHTYTVISRRISRHPVP